MRVHVLKGSAMDTMRYVAEDKLLGYYVNDTKDGRSRLPRGTVIVDHYEGSLGLSLGLELDAGLSVKQTLDLLDGRWDGEKLTQARTNRGADLIFTMPKSVSEAAVAAEAGGNPGRRQRLDDAILEAANWTVRNHVDRKAPLGRRTNPAGKRSPGMQGTPTEWFAGEIIGMPFLQRAARPTRATKDRNAPPDVNLHVHYVIAPIVRDPTTGKYSALDTGKVFRRKWFERMDQAFQHRLAQNLTELGYGIDACGWSDAQSGRVTWELAGSNPGVRRHWSSNHERAIELRRQLEAETGRPVSDKVLNQALYDTRLAKDAEAKRADSLNPVWEAWVEDAQNCGYEVGEFDVSSPRHFDPTLARMELWQRVYSSAGLTRDGAVFTEDDITPTLLRCGNGLGLDEDAMNEAEREIRQELVEVRTPEGPRWTTAPQIAAERFIEAASARKAAEQRPTPPTAIREACVAALEFSLDGRQLAAVEAFCGPNAWTHVTGDAGTGKTTMTATAVATLRAAELVDDVVVVSTAAKAARDTAKKVNATCGWSIDAFERAVRSGHFKPTSRTLLIVEEAGMFSTDGMARTLRAAGKSRVRLLGDAEQLEAIGAAGWYRENIGVHGSVHLNEVRRHLDDADRTAYRSVREGRAADALDSLTKRGRVHVSETADERTALITEHWRAHRDAGRSADQVRIVCDTSNSKVDEFNRWAQRDCLARGELSGEALTLRSQRGDRQWSIYAGDSVLFLRAHGTGRNRIVNGTTALVFSVDTQLMIARLRLDDGRITSMRLQPEVDLQPIGLAYAQHANKMQGAEVEVCLVAPGSTATTNRFTAYSMITRSTHETHIFVDGESHGTTPVENLADAWSEAQTKQTAISLLREAALTPDTTHSAALRAHEHEYAALVRGDAPELDAAALQSAPAWPTLVRRLEALRAEGQHVPTVLHEAVSSRELTTAQDPAAVLVARLDGATRVLALPMTVSVAEQGPQPLVARPKSMAERWKRFVAADRSDPPVSEQGLEPLIRRTRSLSERWDRFRNPSLADRVKEATPEPMYEQKIEPRHVYEREGLGRSLF